MSNVRIGEIPSLDAPAEATRLRKLPCTVTEAGLAIITRAVALRLAREGETKPTDPELYGSALVNIAAQWLASEVEWLRAKKEV